MKGEAASKEGLQVYRRLDERAGLKGYLHGSLDTNTLLKVKVRVGNLDFKERKKRFRKVDELTTIGSSVV